MIDQDYIVAREMPNTFSSLTDEEMEQRFRGAVELAIAEKKLKGGPVARYDKEKHKSYLEYPDVRKEYST